MCVCKIKFCIQCVKVSISMENFVGRDHLGDSGVYVMIVLKLILEKLDADWLN